MKSNIDHSIQSLGDFDTPRTNKVSKMNSMIGGETNQSIRKIDNHTEVIKKLEENEKLFNNQLMEIKSELKQARSKNKDLEDQLKKAIAMGNDGNETLVTMMKTAFEKLIAEVEVKFKLK